MTILWAVMQSMDYYEGSSISGIFSSEEKANEYIALQEANPDPYMKWHFIATPHCVDNPRFQVPE